MLVSYSGGQFGSIFASMALVLENGVDELKAAYEERADVVEAAQSVASDGGVGGVTVILIVLGIAALMLGAVFFAKYRRQHADSHDDDMESPLFEDQYAIQDEEIVIETEEPATAAYHEFTHEQDDEPDPETETIFAESDHHADADRHEPAHSWRHGYEEAEIRIESDPELIMTTNTVVEDDEDEEPAVENVIPMIKRAEPEPVHHAAPEEPARYEAYQPEDVPEPPQDEDYAAHEDAVRYAFASRQQGPMSFSAISEEETRAPASSHHAAASHTHYEEEPVRESRHEPSHQHEEDSLDFRPRSYIAPTVLREDLNRLERLQLAQLDNLRDDVSRQLASLKSDQNNRLDIVLDALDRKLAKLTEIRFEAPKAAPSSNGDSGFVPVLNEFSRQIGSIQSGMDNQAQRIRAITQILDDRLGTVTHVYGEVRSIGEKLDRFSNRMDEMEKSIQENSRLDMMADVQLSDVVRSSLPPDTYEFKPLLSNNHRADCIIRLPHPPGTIVVDTRFPLEAFNALPSREEAARDVHNARAAEDSFRRAVLRHIIDVAERFIIPGETADSALMFVPTEAVYTTLHTRFPDLIRDSFRARVWIVSPSTLMATLQTLRGILSESNANAEKAEKAEKARRHEAEEADAAMRSEMEELRSRATLLAQNLQTTQSELNAILEATDRVFVRPPESAPAQPSGAGRRGDLVNELYDRKAEWPASPPRSDALRYEPEPERRPSSSLYEEFTRRPDPLR